MFKATFKYIPTQSLIKKFNDAKAVANNSSDEKAKNQAAADMMEMACALIKRGVNVHNLITCS